MQERGRRTEDTQDSGGFALVKGRWFFPLGRHELKDGWELPGGMLPSSSHRSFPRDCRFGKKLCPTDISFSLSLPQCHGGEGDVRASGNGDPGLWQVASLSLNEPLPAESGGLFKTEGDSGLAGF